MAQERVGVIVGFVVTHLAFLIEHVPLILMSIPGICINSYKIAQGALFAAWVTFCHMVTEVSFIGCGKVTECASLFEYVFLFFVLQKDVITSCHEVAEVTLFAVGHDVVVGLCNLVHGSRVNHVLVVLRAGSLKINVCYY